MKVSEDVYLVGSGAIGLSNPLDCHVYLLADKQGLALIDAGAGLDTDQILTNVANEGFDPHDIRYLIVTHCHTDHAAGARHVKSQTSCEVVSSSEEKPYIEHGSDEELGLGVCKKSKWYPDDLTYKHCKIDRSLNDKDILSLGAHKISPVVLSGHSYGVLCLLVESGNRRMFFSSDSVFLNGTIGLGNWPGCSLDAYRANISKLRDLQVDELYPGHMLWTLREGQNHLDKAIDNLTYGWIPPIGGHNHPVY